MSSSMPASVRMYHFQKRWTWLDHIQIHIRELKNATRPLNCPCLHSHCPRRFDSVLDLQFHLQDAFGAERSDDTKKIKRPRHGVNGIPPSKRKRMQQLRNDCEESDRMTALQAKYTFGNTCSDVKKGSHIPNRQGFAKSLRFSAARVLLTAKTRRHPVIALAIFRSVRGSN